MAYVLYFVIVLLFFVGLRLPSATIKKVVEQALHEQVPQFVWRIAAVSVQFPFTGVVNGIEAFSPGEQNYPVFVVNRLTITPVIMTLFKGSYSLDYSANLWQGNVSGTVSLPERSTAIVDMKGECRSLLLSQGSRPLTVLGRDVRGKVNGRFHYRGSTDRLQGEGGASMALVSGSVSLIQPLFGMTQVDIDQSQLDLVLHGTEMAITKAGFRSKDFGGEMLGTVSIASGLMESSVNLNGWCELFPSFFVNQHFSDGVQDFLKQRSKEGKILFSLNGLVAAPQFTLK